MYFEDDDGKKQTIRRLSTDEENKFSGVFDGPKGGNIKQIERVEEQQVDTFVKRIQYCGSGRVLRQA